MKPTGLIVWERTGQWASRLRRALGSSRPALREVRSDEELLLRLSQAPASIVAIEFRPRHAGRIAECLWDIEQRFPLARSVVVSDRPWKHFAPVAVESGARAFVTTPRQLRALVLLVRRHLEWVWEMGPPAAATGGGHTAAASANTINEVLDELFEDLAESADRRLVDRAIARLSGRLAQSPC